MWPNDSTYQGTAQNADFYFNSPIAPLSSEEDEYNRSWVYLSERVKQNWANYLYELNKQHQLELPKPNALTSYDNPDYLWLSYELNELRNAYNAAMRDPQTGDVLPGCGQLPYIQLHLKANAFSKENLHPKSTLNTYGAAYRPHYVVEFEQPFLKAFMCFLFEIFDDNPQEFKVINGRKQIVHQYKAPIYRLPPFDKYFDTRHDLPGLMFSRAVQMLLAHEIAHVGGGHLDLQAKDPEYGYSVDTMIAEEDDADAQAICWILGIRFLEVQGRQLEISYEDFRQELALSVFAVYILFTWIYSKDERVWSNRTIEEHGKKGHLPYQLRAYNMLCVSCTRMTKLGEWSERDQIVTLDNKMITVDFMESAFDEAMQMIEAFERAYHMFFAKTEDVYNLALDGKFDELRQMIFNESNEELPQLKKENIPWMLGFEPESQEELKRVKTLWNKVRKRLAENGSYCRLRE